MTLIINDKYFYSSISNEVLTIGIDFSLLVESETYDHKELLLDLFDQANSSSEVKVVVVHNMHPAYTLNKYKQKWIQLLDSDDYESAVLRVFRTFDQIYLKLKALEKVVCSIAGSPTNAMLYNLFMAADLKFISNDFYIDNANGHMANIPKGGAIYNQAYVARMNPIKLLFYSDKILAPELYQKHLCDEIINAEELEKRVLIVANRYCQFSYEEMEAVKVLEHHKIETYETALQRENGFLLSCIRRMKNRKA